jgi:mono/diheme cytochrome c family protein
LLVASIVLAGAVVAAVSLWRRSNSKPVVSALAAAQPFRSPGEQIFFKWCSDCHSTPTGSGTMALERKYKGTPSAILEQRDDLQADYVKAAVRNGISFMPSFRKTEISDAELDQVAAYLAERKVHSNPTVVQP